jgi:hypothetical protein
MKFVRFMTSGIGRGVRVLLGLLMMDLGLFVVQGPLGWIVQRHGQACDRRDEPGQDLAQVA